MNRNPLGLMMKAARVLNRRIPSLDHHELRQLVRLFLKRRDEFLSLARQSGSPLYVIDREAVRKKAQQFRDTFSESIPRLRIYFAFKSNSHPEIARTLVDEGVGLDVSSGIELDAALRTGVADIIFSGPGKRPEELALAVENSSRVTVLLDSFSELDRLEWIAGQAGVKMRAGVRLTSDDHGIWRKFGIPLDRLGTFFSAADKRKHVDLQGLQFHLSWNMTPEAQVLFIARLGSELRRLDAASRAKIKFVDIGGGFWPEQGEWLQYAATPSGQMASALGQNTIRSFDHFHNPASKLSDFAQRLSVAIQKHLPVEADCATCVEPGRWLCHEGMHILLTVVDRKGSDVVITDGGTNAVGWDRYETDFFPVINLTRPGQDEHECLIAGSLCTPHDLWGYSYFGRSIQEGDLLLVPYQGAYTYSLRQEFIKPLPKSVCLNDAATANFEHRLDQTGRTEGAQQL